MSNWKEYKLGNHIDVINGFAFKSSDFLDEKKDNALPVIKIKNVANGDVHLNGVQYHLYDEALSKYQVNNGDVLLALTGNHPHAMTQVVGEASRYKLNIPSLLNQRVAKIVPKQSLNIDYLYYFLKDEFTHDYLASQSSGSANQANISKSDIENIPINLPPLTEQFNISKTLSSLDNKIDLLNRQNKTLEQLAETLFRQWFVEELEENWAVDTLGNVFDIGIGRTPPRKEHQWFTTNPIDVKWVSIKDMGTCGIYIDSVSEYLTQDAVKRFNIPVIPENTVMLSFKMTIGRLAISTEKILSNEAIAHFIQKEKSILFPEFLYLFLKTFRWEQLGSTSSIVEAINSQMIKDIEMIIPDEIKLNNFKALIKPYFKKIKTNQNQIRTLTQLRDNLLPKLMSGEVRVKI